MHCLLKFVCVNSGVPEDVELFLEEMFVVTWDDDVIASGFPDVIVVNVVGAMHTEIAIFVINHLHFGFFFHS